MTNSDNSLPQVIQGGMGVAVSSWLLARAVSARGQLGVVSGTGIDTVLIRRLQDGDPAGIIRRAMEAFPIPGVAENALARYFRSGGKPADAPYQLLPMYRLVASREREAITMLAAFVEVHLAREGHQGPVGINLLTKVQRPNLAVLYGAMLAGVEYVLMGAGIPREIPALLDALAGHRRASLRLDVLGLPPDKTPQISLDPADYWQSPVALARPRFLPIVASNSLAAMLVHKLGGGIDGLIIEGPTAGGHNAPPRGTPEFNARGEPVYGNRDMVDLDRIRELGVPFWLAGGTGNPAALRDALSAGAAGIQVGTLFAFCDESGLTPELKRSVLSSVALAEVDVLTDPFASPTGYPFKVVEWSGNLAHDAHRDRVCDLGYLRVAYVRPDGRVGYRCAAEPVDAYVEKGGEARDTVGRRCLCNALMANVGLAQLRDNGAVEPVLLTSGDDLISMRGFLGGRASYTADDVLAYLLGNSIEGARSQAVGGLGEDEDRFTFQQTPVRQGSITE